MGAAVATLIELATPRIGISMTAAANLITSGEPPPRSSPRTTHTGKAEKKSSGRMLFEAC
jgi:hypothetical protein